MSDKDFKWQCNACGKIVFNPSDHIWHDYDSVCDADEGFRKVQVIPI